MAAFATACGCAVAQSAVPASALPRASAPAPATATALPALPVLHIHYQVRPPYSSDGAPGGAPVGLLADPVGAALQRAGIAHQWVRTPSQRQLGIIQAGTGPDCGLGWFRNAEREARGRYSRAIYQDKPFVALTRRGAAMAPDRPLAEWLGQTRLPLLVKDGYSYGPVIDAQVVPLLAEGQGVRRTVAESQQMVRMIDAGRAGWMLVAPEEADELLRQVPEVAQRLVLLPLADVPEGSTRHLYCSLAVPEALVARIDRALDERR